MLILDVLAKQVAQRGDHAFIIHEGQRVSYRSFDERTNQVAHALRDLGVQKGDRVTLAMSNCIEYLLSAFGVFKAGAVMNPINPALGTAELTYIMGHAEPRVVVTNDDAFKQIAPALPDGVPVACFGGADNSIDFQQRVAAAPSKPTGIAIAPDDASTLLYTSGTTGNPKGVLFHHKSTGAAGMHFLETLGINGNDTILAVTPLFHGNAWGATVTSLQAGGTLVFPKIFSASQFWPLVHETHATVLYTLGTILAILLTQEPSDLERDNPLRVILGLGSAPIRERIVQRFGIQHVAECFGSTDAGVVTIEPLGQAPRPGSAGPPVPGVEIRILDDNGNALPTRSVGEIVIHSPHRMAEYFRDPEQTQHTLRGDWFYTGDLGYLDEDGWLYFVDRKRDVIRRGGENISSVLIEKTLREHPSVVDAAVIGLPDPVLGQEIKAFVVAKSPVSEDELRAFAAARLAKFQVPRLWEFRESLPKTASMRVEKYKLRQESGATGKALLG
ncbi:MAG TPA: AMP-binding protein [Candidatus Acidoferrales bacterium]|nr:AMP-binding protein [Candidatus Acidoferrales bacterium]